jgi:hypothetical protein
METKSAKKRAPRRTPFSWKTAFVLNKWTRSYQRKRAHPHMTSMISMIKKVLRERLQIRSLWCRPHRLWCQAHFRAIKLSPRVRLKRSLIRRINPWSFLTPNKLKRPLSKRQWGKNSMIENINLRLHLRSNLLAKRQLLSLLSDLQGSPLSSTTPQVLKSMIANHLKNLLLLKPLKHPRCLKSTRPNWLNSQPTSN